MDPSQSQCFHRWRSVFSDLSAIFGAAPGSENRDNAHMHCSISRWAILERIQPYCKLIVSLVFIALNRFPNIKPMKMMAWEFSESHTCQALFGCDILSKRALFSHIKTTND